MLVLAISAIFPLSACLVADILQICVAKNTQHVACACRNGGGQADMGQLTESNSRLTLEDIRAGASSDLPRAEACPHALDTGAAPAVHPDTPFADPYIQV